MVFFTGEDRRTLRKLKHMLLEDGRDVHSIVARIHDLARDQRDIREWMELIADIRADKVQAEFERLLDEHTAKGRQVTNKALGELVHTAVVNSK